MKKAKKIIGLFTLAVLGGCTTPRSKDFHMPVTQPTFSDPDLTLIKKEIPKCYSFSFERTHLYFSTNKTQQTHAILTRHLCPDTLQEFRQIPIGKTMKKDEWDRYLMTDKICPATGRTHFNNWQKFYQ